METFLKKLCVLGVCLLAACGPGSTANGGDSVDTNTETSTPDDGQSTDSSTPSCNPGSLWEPGTKAFTRTTSAWGLDGVMGIRLAVSDIDNDGWPDLLVRNGGGPDDFGPEGNRSRWILRNTGNGTFEDVTQATGILTLRLQDDPNLGRPGQVFTTADVNNDGLLDIYTGQSRTDPTTSDSETSEIMLSNGDGTFRLGPEDSAARFANEPSNPAGVSFIDYNLDGNLDIWITHNELPGLVAMPDRLLRGDGEGGFVDVTDETGLHTEDWHFFDNLNNAKSHSWAWGAVACDLNNDGIAELMASSYGRAPNHLWRGVTSPQGTLYLNESVASGYAFDHRTDWRDNLSAQCFCRDNPSESECDTCPLPDDNICASLANAFGPNYRWNHAYGRELFSLGGNSGTTVCADINNDGYQDLMTHEIVHHDVGTNSDPSELLVNQGDTEVRFERPGNEVTGLTRIDPGSFWDHGDMTGTVFDFDNDGWLDIYIGASDYPGNKGLLYHQDSPLSFQRLEVADYFEHFRSHGVAVADFDRDGDVDIVVGHSRHRCSGPAGVECGETSQIEFFENQMGSTSNWLQLRLEGTQGSNRAAIGARVVVVTEDTQQTRHVDGGHGHFGLQQDLVLHFGLGNACTAQITVHWPDNAGTSQEFSVDANQILHIRQGDTPTALILKP